MELYDSEYIQQTLEIDVEDVEAKMTNYQLF